MTAPVTSPTALPSGERRTVAVVAAPRVQVTPDGIRWTLRGRSPEGEALYAMAGVRDCPHYVMARASELAEMGAEVVPPAPVLGPQEQAARVLPLLLAEARAAGLPEVPWTLPRRERSLLGGVDFAGMGPWTAFLLETGESVAQRMSDVGADVRYEVSAVWRGVRLELTAFAPAGTAVAP